MILGSRPSRGFPSEMPQIWCKLWILLALCKFVVKSYQFCSLHQVALTFWKSELMQLSIWRLKRQVVETTYINWRINCHQDWASDASTSWYRFDDCKVTSLQQTCCNLHVSGCVEANPNIITRVLGENSRLSAERGVHEVFLQKCHEYEASIKTTILEVKGLKVASLECPPNAVIIFHCFEYASQFFKEITSVTAP